MRALYQQHKISPPAAELGWSHQVELLSLPDARLRRQLAKRAQGRQLTRDELRALVQQARERLDGRRSSDGHAPPRLLTPKRGTSGLFHIKDVEGTRYWDLGFESYRELSAAQGRIFKVGDLVRWMADGPDIFLNNRLLETGHARLYETVSLDDWAA